MLLNGQKHQAPSIRLISFASMASSDSLSDAVRGMNYELETVNGTEWLNGQASEPANAIVLLDRVGREQNQIIKRLPDSGRPQMLAVMDHTASELDSTLLSHFQDFFTWPSEPYEVKYRLDRLFKSVRSTRSSEIDEALCERLNQLGMIGRSEGFLNAMSELIEFAQCDVPIMISGETGTGKELAARAVHQTSHRAQHPFVSVNCGAIPDNLIENELFGHERGAFTDAKEMRKGLVDEAENGTLFLDEIDTLSTSAQVALLRLVQSQEYRSLGGKGTKIANVRVISATNANLMQLVEQGKFRRDLLYRLDVCGVTLPPLRERGQDIELLSDHLLQEFAQRHNKEVKTLHPGMLAWMREHQWKGNIRELGNILLRQFLLSKGRQVFSQKPGSMNGDSASSSTRYGSWKHVSYKDAKKSALDSFERSYLVWLMSEAKGNLSYAARKTQQQRSSLRRLLTKHAIDKNEWKR